MWAPERVLVTLRERGELWQSAPGLVGLRGATLGLFRAIENAVSDIAASETDDDWRVPSGIALETLARADYFSSFPQWLTAAAHLSGDEDVLRRVATDPVPAVAARSALAPADAALPPALCYHIYAALAGRTINSAMLLTTQGTCWRHEGARLVPLERGWAFTMREIVCIGSAEEVEAFRRRGMTAASTLVDSLGLEAELAQASDPFFAPTGRGRALLQRIKSLKHELMLTLGPGHSIAAASFNNHERFFGEAFDLRLPNGEPASSACVAFGLERWLLAVLTRYGAEPDGWPIAVTHGSQSYAPLARTLEHAR